MKAGERGLFAGRRPASAVRYTDKPVSGWGGLVAVQRYPEKRGAQRYWCRRCWTVAPLPNQIPVLDIAWTFFGDGADRRPGASRTLERLRSDAVRTILGVTRMPSAMTLTRYFGGLVRSQTNICLAAVLGNLC